MIKYILTICTIVAIEILFSSFSWDEYIKRLSSNDVTIGTQVWMTKNLDVSKFRNGDLIPEAKTNIEWIKAGNDGRPAWCYYNNDPINGTKYGKLYNWYAVNDSRGLAPIGYHVPNVSEWDILIDYLGGKDIAGGKMKSTDKQYWSFPLRVATNESGFLGLPGGERDGNDCCNDTGGECGYWWSSSQHFTYSAWRISLCRLNGIAGSTDSNKILGYSVRCLRD